MTDWLIPCQPSVCQSVSSEQNYVMGHKSILFGSVPFQDNSFLSYTYCVQGTPTTTGALRTEYSSSSYVKDLWFHLSIHGGRHSRPTITTLTQSVWMFSAVTKKKSGREEGRYVHFATNCFIGYMLLFYGYVYNGYGEYLEGTGIQYECYRKECRRRFCVKRCRGDALCMCGNAALLLMVVGEGQIIIKILHESPRCWEWIYTEYTEHPPYTWCEYSVPPTDSTTVAIHDSATSVVIWWWGREREGQSFDIVR